MTSHETTKKAIARFTDRLPPDAAQAFGSKGYLLNRLVHAGFRVPLGFTISIDTACQLLTVADDDPMWQLVWAEIEWLEQATNTQLGHIENPLVLAVRSGAAVSMPGMLTTHLGVGVTQPMLSAHDGTDDHLQRVWSYTHADAKLATCASVRAQLQAAIKSVAQSWHNPSAVEFRRQQNVPKTGGTAVTVQQFVLTDLSGVLFTRHPDARCKEQMLVEFSERGGAVVDGAATPESLELSRVAKQYLPSDKGIAWQQLVAIALRMEQASCWSTNQEADPLPRTSKDRKGLDIEWGWQAEDQTFYIFQARLAQSLAGASDASQSPRCQPNSGSLRPDIVYVRHELNDTLQKPTPLTWSFVRQMFSTHGALGNVYRQLGFLPPVDSVDPLIELIQGDIYLDADRASQLFLAGLPFRYDFDELINAPELIETAPTHFDPDACGPWFLLQLPWRLCRYGWATRSKRPRPSTFKHSLENAQRKLVESTVSASTAGSLTTQQLVDAFECQTAYVYGELAEATLSWSMFAGLAGQQLERTTHRYVSDLGKASSIAQQLLANHCDWPLTPIVAAQWVINGRWDAYEFQRQFGHRAVNEWELSAVPFRLELPKFDTAQRSPAQPIRESYRDAFGRVWLKRSWDDPQALAWLEQHVSPRKAKQILRVARRVSALAPYRELARDVWLRGLDGVRRILEQLADRLDLNNGTPADIHFLQADEIVLDQAKRGAAEPDSNRREPRSPISARRAAWQADHKQIGPRVIDTRDIASVTSERSSSSPASANSPSSMALQGVGLATGQAEGTAWHLGDSHEPPSDAGYILICESLDTQNLSHFLQAKGIVTERGGILSHAAIVARQCNIPLIRLPDARELVGRGQCIRIDGDAGTCDQRIKA